MKKSIVFFLAIITTFSATSQNSNASVGLVAGVTSSNMYGTVTGADVDYKQYLGYTFGMVVDAPFKKGHFSFQPGLHYTQKGATTLDVKNQKDYYALRYADLVANLVYNTHGDKGGNFYFGAGPQLGANLPSKKVTVFKPGDTKSESNVIFGNDVASDFRGIDFGANIIAGYTMKCGFTFAANYNFGVRNLVPAGKNNDDKLRNSQIGIRLGYFFRSKAEKKETVVAPVVTPAPENKPVKKAKQPKPVAPPVEKDTDGDGILDKDDACVDVPGLRDNYGCPELILYYKRDVSTPDDWDKAEMDKVIEYYNKNVAKFQNINLKLIGHASTTGTAEHNQKLSEQRAQHAKEYLVSKGLPAARISTIGYGEKYPIGDQKTEEGRARSRRVVVRIEKN